MDLGPDEGDQEQYECDQEDDENCHMIRVVKVRKDKVKVNGVLGLEESCSVACEMVGLTLSPDPHVVLELNLQEEN